MMDCSSDPAGHFLCCYVKREGWKQPPEAAGGKAWICWVFQVWQALETPPGLLLAELLPFCFHAFLFAFTYFHIPLRSQAYPQQQHIKVTFLVHVNLGRDSAWQWVWSGNGLFFFLIFGQKYQASWFENTVSMHHSSCCLEALFLSSLVYSVPAWTSLIQRTKPYFW